MQSLRKLRPSQHGLTLVELLVAMVISLVIAIAAISALLISRQGFATVDAASQLRDNARFAADMVQRLAVQAGFLDVEYAAKVRLSNNIKLEANPPPSVSGYNNATPSSSDPLNTSIARTGGVGYGSDVLILRSQTATVSADATTSDGSMINCAGIASTSVSTELATLDNRIVSVIHVGVSSTGEPQLMCTYQKNDGTFPTPQPLVEGVENFQVLYGVDNVVPNLVPTGVTDSVADRYLRADQMTVAGNDQATNDNWRRVRTLRIGMVLRGPVGSAQDTTPQVYYPFGQAKNSAGVAGLAMASPTNDPGTKFEPGADRRLRQVVTFTVHLRNEQGF